MIISNSSPLISLSRIDRLDILKELFGKIYIPPVVYKETVEETNIIQQREAISKAISQMIISVVETTYRHFFSRNLDAGEKDVLNLAIERKANAIIIDDKKARNEAKVLGFTILYTTDILKGAEKRSLINSYQDIIDQLKTLKIYLPG